MDSLVDWTWPRKESVKIANMFMEIPQTETQREIG